MLAEVTEFGWGTIANGGAAVGVITILAYLIRVTLPRIVQEFREDTAAQRESHERQMSDLTKAYREEMAVERGLSEQRAKEWRNTLIDVMRKHDAS